MDYLGAENASIVLYIDNMPLLSQRSIHNKVDTKELVTDNGNHWRKIVTIFAKLCCITNESKQDWRIYRDDELLKDHQQVCFTDRVNQRAKMHFFSGKSCWQRFGITDIQLQKMERTECGKVYYCFDQQGLLFYTPYFDYRQFPNKLIDEVLKIISDHG